MATRRTSDSTRTPPQAAPTQPPPAKSVTTRPAKASAESRSTPPAAPTKATAVSRAAAPAGVKADVPDTPSATSNPAPAKRVAKPATPKVSTASRKQQVSDDTRRGMIAESAYLRAERRGFAPGHEDEDWCAAEKEVDALLNVSTGASPQ